MKSHSEEETMKVFVVMGNEHPAAVFAHEELAEKYMQEKRKEDRINAHLRRTYWRFYDFELMGHV